MKTPRKSAKDIQAVVLGYNAGRGILLCKHASHATLDDAIEAYLRSPKGKNWFAHFRWNDLAIEDQELLQSELRDQRKLESKQLSLNHVLTGKTVDCKLEKNPTWRAVQIELHREGKSFHIPKNRRKKPILGSSRKRSSHSGTQRIDNRLSAASRPSTNIQNPWRG